jgi:hypothetical protein
MASPCVACSAGAKKRQGYFFRDEAQQLAGALLDAEVRLGQLFQAMPTNQGARTDKEPSNNGVTKYEIIRDLGFDEPKMTASRFEALASHVDIVERVKASYSAMGFAGRGKKVPIDGKVFKSDALRAAEALRRARFHSRSPPFSL